MCILKFLAALLAKKQLINIHRCTIYQLYSGDFSLLLQHDCMCVDHDLLTMNYRLVEWLAVYSVLFHPMWSRELSINKPLAIQKLM